MSKELKKLETKVALGETTQSFYSEKPVRDVWCGALWVAWSWSVSCSQTRFSGTRSRTSVPSRVWEAGGSVKPPGAPGLTAGKWRRRTTTCSSCCWSGTAASGRPACCSGSARTPSTPPSSPPSVSSRPPVHRRRLFAVLAAELTAADRESESRRGGGYRCWCFSSEPGDLWPHWSTWWWVQQPHWSRVLISSVW